MQVRMLCPSDLPAAIELLDQLGYRIPFDELRARIERVLASKTHYAAVAEHAGRVVGLIHTYERLALEKPCEAVVQSLVVDQRERKAGTGKLLMGAAEAWARDKGLAHLVLHTRTDREDARAFYEQIGYRRVATSHLMGKALESA